MSDPETEQTFINAFTLMPKGTQKLQEYCDEHYDALCAELYDKSGERPVTKGLAELVDAVLPEESKPYLHNVLINRSDRVVVIHGFPERKGLENEDHPVPWEIPLKTYTFFIGNAIYDNYQAKHSFKAGVPRERNKPIEAKFIHRDLLGEHIIFSSPYNGEHAHTEFIQLQRAIESIPKEKRERIRVKIVRRYAWDKEKDFYSLEEALQDLNTIKIRREYTREDKHCPLVRIILDCDPQVVPEAQEFLDAIRAHTKSLDIQPGTIAVICEDRMYHSSAPGDPDQIALIPPTQKYTRLFVHNAGASTAI